MRTEQAKLNQIAVRSHIQQRDHLNDEYIEELVVEIDNGVKFPPLVVFDDGENLLLSDGRHRYEAYLRAEVETIEVNIYEGNERDAILYAAGSNADHGLRRSNADKRKAVTTLLTDSEWGNLSDNEISQKCRVTQPFVSKVRRELTQNGFEWGTTRICADGREMDTSSIGAKCQTGESENSLAVEGSGSPLPDMEFTDNNEEDQVPEEDYDHNTDSDASVEMATPDHEDESQADDGIDKCNFTGSENLFTESESDQSSGQESSEDNDSDDYKNYQSFPVDESAGFEKEGVSVDSEPEADENLLDELADISDVEILKAKIIELRNTIKEQDYQLNCKDNQIDELEREIKELKDTIKYYEDEIMGLNKQGSELDASAQNNFNYQPMESF